MIYSPSTTDKASDQIPRSAKRPHPDAAMLPVNSGSCVPSEFLIRKKLRMEVWPSTVCGCGLIHAPPPQAPADTGHAQIKPSPDTVAKGGTHTKTESKLDEVMEDIKKEESFLSSFWRWVVGHVTYIDSAHFFYRSIKTLFGW